MNQNELYKTLAVETPRPEIVETPKPEVAVVEPQKSITDEEAGFELDNLATSLYEQYEKLSPAQRFVAEVAPGTGEAISAYETPKYARETKEAFEEGNYGQTAIKGLLTAMSAIGSVPILGAAVRAPKAIVKTGAKKILQEFTSAKTSRPQIAAIFKDKNFDIKPGEINIDIGGGKFDKGSDYLKKNKKAKNLVYDIFNRSKEHNNEILNTISKKPADTATVANVLNVIKEPEIRKSVIEEENKSKKRVAYWRV